MQKLPEIIYGSSDKKRSREITKLSKEGKIRKIASRLYTSNLELAPEAIVRQNVFAIVGNLYPEALISHRSALEFTISPKDNLYLTFGYTRNVELPGVTVRFMEGPDSIEGDKDFFGMMVSQDERAYLENLQSSRLSSKESKTLDQSVIEEKLETIIRVKGEAALNMVRDRAKKIAETLNFEKEYEKLDKIISALLATHPSKVLTSPVAAARAFGHPYDAARIKLFGTLFAALNQNEFPIREDRNSTQEAYESFAFYESYFSNYIEGTVFDVDEAKEVIEKQQPLPARNEDSHDVLGTYKLVSDSKEMAIVPSTPEELLSILKERHEILLSARRTKNPGVFKHLNNRAVRTEFVDFELVIGTFFKAFEFYRALRQPFAKAAYVMFVISEVHPFLDGNGRIARVMMNAELGHVNQTKIIIPTVYREDYLGALRRLSRRSDPSVYIKMLQRAQAFSHTIVGTTKDEMEAILEKSNAFDETTERVLKIVE